eukprot:scaffold5300_cov101-Isochrysis_galbana.AAC.2
MPTPSTATRAARTGRRSQTGGDQRVSQPVRARSVQFLRGCAVKKPRWREGRRTASRQDLASIMETPGVAEKTSSQFDLDPISAIHTLLRGRGASRPLRPGPSPSALQLLNEQSIRWQDGGAAGPAAALARQSRLRRAEKPHRHR